MQEVDDLTLLVDAIRDAGKIATTFSGKNAQSWEKSDGTGPVTEADLAVNTMLQEKLRAARPSYGWLSEENEDDTARLSQDRVFIIDPIDGTRNFMNGGDTWAHALAVAEKGRVICAAVYLPVLDKLYCAQDGQGATFNDAPINVSKTAELKGASVLAAKPNYDAHHWRDEVPDVMRSYRPSLAYRLSLVAEGRFDAMLTLRKSWEWDIAAGDLIIREAGGVTSTQRGGALKFNNPHPMVDGVVAAGAPVHQALLKALKP